LVEHIQQEIRPVGSWQKAQAQEVVRSWIVRYLDDQDVLE
jgi:type I restriction enzyme R subunit